MREQPSNPQTWLALGRYDLSADPSAAVKDLQAAIYLNPESIAPELLTREYNDPEAVEIYNDYIQALRASARAAAVLRTASAPPVRAAAGARRAASPTLSYLGRVRTRSSAISGAERPRV